MTPRTLAAALATALLLLLTAPGAAAQDDPALDQVIGAGEAVVAGPATLEVGHIDIGPRFVEDRWQLLVRDDSAIPSVWRDLDDVVLRVTDAAARPIPDDPTYAFLGAEPGDRVHVVPQIQSPEVIWLGWNTQDPDVMARIDRGATLTLRGVQGPGQLTVYLQAGNLTEPEVLWTSTDDAAQPLWVDVNTHTHANWVFTEPGEYLVLVEASAELIAGETVSDTRLLRFAVGDATSVEQTRTAAFTEAPAADRPGDAAGDRDPVSEDGDTGGLPVVPLVAGAAGLALVAGLAVARSNSARRRAIAQRQQTGP